MAKVIFIDDNGEQEEYNEFTFIGFKDDKITNCANNIAIPNLIAVKCYAENHLENAIKQFKKLAILDDNSCDKYIEAMEKETKEAITCQK